MINKKRIIENFINYVKINSESAAEKNMADTLVKELKKLGLSVTVDDAFEKGISNTGNIVAKLFSSKDKETFLFSSHMDTVKPGKNINPIIDKNIIRSDGTTILGADDKAGIAAIMEALYVIKENNLEHKNIEIIFSVHEEGGLFGAKNIDLTRIKSTKAFILDSGGHPGEVIHIAPAQDKIEVNIKGKPSHAGIEPENGISSIMVAARAIEKMDLLRIDKETTANIGIIRGGESTNIVCSSIYLKGEARSLSDEKLDKQTEHMTNCFRDAAKDFGAKIEIKTKRVYYSYNIDRYDEIIKIAEKAINKVGLNFKLKSSGGGSDTNVYNRKGLKSINLAIGLQKSHTLDEFIEIEDLFNSAKIVLELMK
ncbi:M20/M25/M40 family metallo-hydrolase [Helicovermis profundi]|uniref:M20/M25/M40 family metallo-hydrolase n=1 Tax=Helicovermis profundi TaxID=3065157 RepID=A0AAU9E579_9FIRM|nr:M20/M25/M40 family metallo-hydrolase [Clostridia bacterium S502]